MWLFASNSTSSVSPMANFAESGYLWSILMSLQEWEIPNLHAKSMSRDWPRLQEWWWHTYYVLWTSHAMLRGSSSTSTACNQWSRGYLENHVLLSYPKASTLGALKYSSPNTTTTTFATLHSTDGSDPSHCHVIINEICWNTICHHANCDNHLLIVLYTSARTQFLLCSKIWSYAFM